MSTYQAHKMKKKKAQAAIEFIVLIVILFSVFMVYTVSTRKKIDEIRDKKEYVLLTDAVKMAQNEILTAVKVEDGYYREFDMPETLEGIEYNISITGAAITGNTENHEQVAIIPSVNGTLNKGANIITKQDGIVQVN